MPEHILSFQNVTAERFYHVPTAWQKTGKWLKQSADGALNR
jgi:hypothetical protein